MPDKTPKKIPTYEEFADAMGLDAMSFMHDMVTPDDPEAHDHEAEDDEYKD